MRRLSEIALMVLCAIACRTTPEPPRAANDFHLTVVDHPGDARFNISLQAGSSPICFAHNEWPNLLGRVEVGATLVVTTDRGRFPARDHESGSCIGPDCIIRLRPGQRIEAFVPYSEFPAEAAVASSGVRRLAYEITPYQC